MVKMLLLVRKDNGSQERTNKEKVCQREDRI